VETPPSRRNCSPRNVTKILVSGCGGRELQVWRETNGRLRVSTRAKETLRHRNSAATTVTFGKMVTGFSTLRHLKNRKTISKCVLILTTKHVSFPIPEQTAHSLMVSQLGLAPCLAPFSKNINLACARFARTLCH